MYNENPTIEIFYFTGKACSVCVSLKPKIIHMVSEKYKDITLKIVDIEEEPVTAASHMVFTLPVIIIKFDGREHKRFARSFSVAKIEDTLDRIIDLLG